MAKGVDEMTSDELMEELLKLKLQEAKTLSPNSKEFKDAMDGIANLYKAQTESFRLNVESDYKRIEIEKERKSSILEWILKAVGIGAPLALYAALWHRGMKFEETGTYSSAGMRRLNNDMKLKI